ncbi:MAG: GGDEF domain-containing protein [Lachnospiraceae bacterium]|nr:GGDEF domain-containing protein [Lachnospiraceae bacterium]
MEIFRDLKKFLNKDLSGEGRANSRIVLLRYIISILTIWYIGVSVYCGILSLAKYAVAFIVTSVAFCILLYASYQTDNNKGLLGGLALVTAVSSIYITKGFGWRPSFHNYMYLVMVLLWYDPEIQNRMKGLYSVLITVLVCIISFTTGFGDTVLNPQNVSYHVLVMLNVGVFCLCLSIVAYFFCTQFVAAEQKLMSYNKKLKHIADVDPLTQLMNRRSAMERINEISERYESNNNPVSIAIGDIDFFKKVNDTYGHDCGDYVLKTIAGIFNTDMDNKGFVCRWGGEEFLFVFTSMNGDEAFIELNTLREQIERFKFLFKGNEFNLTMTFGIDEFSNNIPIDEVIKAADEKLYMGKEGGRNQVVY